jgi:DNA polymerase-3 subunit epsilon
MLNRILRLERPLAIFDLETTGLNKDRDRIIQIAITMFYPEPEREPVEWWSYIHPEMPIPESVSGINDDDVKDAPKFREIAPELGRKMLSVDVGGHNASNFDIDFLKAEFRRVNCDWPWRGHIVDTLAICRLKDAHTLSNAYKRYVDPNGFEGAHKAQSDVAATVKLLAAQLNHHQDLPRTVPELVEMLNQRNPNFIDKNGKFVWQNDQPCINFGKWRGTPLSKIDKGYLVNNTQNFPDDALVIAGNALKGIYPTKS